jgi:hypothetical protein
LERLNEGAGANDDNVNAQLALVQANLKLQQREAQIATLTLTDCLPISAVAAS